MATKNKAVFGIYSTYNCVEDAVNSLKKARFRATDISALFQENPGSKDLICVNATKAPEGAVVGAVCGAVFGGALCWLVSIGALLIPGLGPMMAAGPIVAALSGVGAGGVAGGIVGGLIGLATPKYEARRYAGRVKKGGFLLSVHCDDAAWTKRAEQILECTGADDISSADEARADYAVSDKPSPRHAVAGDR